MQQNRRYRLCGEWDETINHIISECSKLAQREDKTRYDRVGEGDSTGIVQEIEVRPYEKLVYAQLGISPGEWDT